jgi:hypothetical protein
MQEKHGVFVKNTIFHQGITLYNVEIYIKNDFK